MIRSRMAAIVTPALALTLASCTGPAEGLVPVTGKLVCDGQPAAGAVLSFQRQAGEPAPPRSAAGIIPSATVRDDGSFTVESGPLGRGAPPGKYNVLVQWPEQADAAASGAGGKTKTARVGGKQVVVAKHDKLDPLPADRLKGRYSDAGNPRLQAEIKPGPNDLSYEVTLK
jgi:hypothetical protein